PEAPLAARDGGRQPLLFEEEQPAPGAARYADEVCRFQQRHPDRLPEFLQRFHDLHPHPSLPGETVLDSIGVLTALSAATDPAPAVRAVPAKGLAWDRIVRPSDWTRLSFELIDRALADGSTGWVDSTLEDGRWAAWRASTGCLPAALRNAAKAWCASRHW